MILQNQIDKYSARRTINSCVYKLSYGGKYIIVKGKTLAGSLYQIQKVFPWFKETMRSNLYYHFYMYVIQNPGKKFTVRVLSRSRNHYTILKREQIELDKGLYEGNMLNNSLEAYVPLWNEEKGTYGSWIDKMAVMNFRKYLKSKVRKQFLKELRKSNGLK